MKKFKKVNNDVKKSVEAYLGRCTCTCDCSCNPFYGYPSEIGSNAISSVQYNKVVA